MEVWRGVEDEANVVRWLDGIDWNFPGAGTLRGTVHALHWFPGNFIPQIPAHFVQLLSRPGDLVLDPFCGSGTSGAEACRLGRRSRQSDVCQASIQVSEGKLALLGTPNLGEECGHVFEELHFEGLARREWHGNPELAQWLERDTLEQLSFIWCLIEGTRDGSLRAILELLFSDVLFACASTGGSSTSSGGRRRHHWGWIADNVKPKALRWHNAIQAFRERMMVAIDVARSEAREERHEAVVVREAAADLSCGEAVADLVVTSPPYLGVIDYALANRLSYLWMGWDVDRDRGQELGSRRGRDNRRAREEYLSGIEACVDRMCRAMKPRAYCAIVVGASRKYESVAEDALDLFGRRLRRVWGPVNRIVSRRRVAERRGRLGREWVCVFRKD